MSSWRAASRCWCSPSTPRWPPCCSSTWTPAASRRCSCTAASRSGAGRSWSTRSRRARRWWNPAVEDQATDRAYRIGQDRPVQVHRLIAEGTLEDRIAALLEKKRELADAVIGSGEGWIAELSDSELTELVSLRAAV